MSDRRNFAQHISQFDLTRAEQAISFLWFYRFTQTYEDRTASELAEDLEDEGLGRPNVTHLHGDLTKSRQTVKGKRAKSFQLHTKYVPQLTTKYGSLLNIKQVDATPSVIPADFVQGSRPHLERLVKEINGAYNYQFYDASAVLIRRLLESLIIEVFIHKKLVHEIRVNNAFLMLDKLISRICNHQHIVLSRNAPKSMDDIKTLGDTAAHDRTYLIAQPDIDDLKSQIRRTIKELLVLADIQAAP
jgi:hypothetical protein